MAPSRRWPRPAATALDLTGLSGILEYDPGEYTFTARAGTPLAHIRAALAEHGQYLPFDPPLVEQGATLGGTIAAGLSGAGRMRYGGVRDFLIGVRFVDGQGRLVRGGGKVVKNAAGFDLPKLMVGSLGRLGVLVEASFKVFPAPQAYTTTTHVLPTLDAAIAAVNRLAGSTLDLEALDFAPAAEDADGRGATRLWVRQGGLPQALPARQAGVLALLGGGETPSPVEDAAFWAQIGAFDWLPGAATLAKVATTPGQVAALDAALADAGAQRHYSVAGNLAWIGWPGEITRLAARLEELGLAGLVLTGAPDRGLIGRQATGPFLARIKQTLDPDGRFPDFMRG